MKTESGVAAIGPLPWGAHICHFYRSGQDLADTLVPYFKAGIENSEKCVWITREPLDAVAARQALERAVPSLDELIANGQVEILDDDIYREQAPQEILRAWWAHEQRALERGYAGLRLAGNTSSIAKRDWGAFMSYEHAVHDSFAPRKIIALCSYSLEQCAPEDLIEATNCHEYVVLRRNGESHLMESAARRTARVARERLLEEMVAILAHDISTPLSAVRLSAALLQERGADTELTQQILRGSNEMLRMRNDLVELVRQNRGDGLNLTREPIDLNELCRDVVAEFRRLHPGRSLEFRSEVEARGEWDTTRLRQVLYNLLKNALAYSPPNTPVELATDTRDHRVLIRVRNQGVIPDQQLPSLFEPFKRGRGSRGLGLGLYIAKKIIESHGGRLDVSTSPRDGTVFTAVL